MAEQFLIAYQYGVVNVHVDHNTW